MNISMNTTTGRVRYKWTSNERKAMSLSDDYCGQSGKEIKVSQLQKFNHTGYYYICIIPEQPTHYEINVTEYYYSRPFTNSDECEVSHYHSSKEQKCCNFSFHESFKSLNCVYLTTRNKQPDKKHMDKPHPVTVYMKYNIIVKILTVVIVVSLLFAASVLISITGYYLYRARRAQQQQNN